MANGLTMGALALKATINCIGVRASYTGDDNSNATATIQFKASSSGTWLDAYTPIVDRRALIATAIGDFDNTANRFQARGSIVGLLENTAYDVRVTWTDADGVTGTNPVSGSITTSPLVPPTGGSQFYVDAAAASEGVGSIGDPFKTIANGITNTAAGDTLNLRAGTYASMTITTSGSAGAFRVLQQYQSEVAIIGAGAANSLTITANYWRIKGLKFVTAPGSAMIISSNQHHLYIEECVSVDYGTRLTTNGDAFVTVGQSNHDIFILRNTVAKATDTGYNDVGDGIFTSGDGTYNLVYDGNNFTGCNAFKGIGNGVNSFGDAQENSDFCRNTIIDGINSSTIELDGGSVNLRVWGNTIHGATFDDAISEAGTIVGPSYLFRNDMLNTHNAVNGGYKLGHYGTGYHFSFHNTLRVTGTGGAICLCEGGGTDRSENHVYKNNIFDCELSSVYDHQGRSNSYDYNCIRTVSGTLVTAWDDTATDYSTIALFRAGTGEETHGIEANPNFVNPASDLHVQAGSPTLNVGLVLANFNDANSFWPYGGAAPDLGAYEYETPAAPPSAPTNLRLVGGVQII